MVVLAKVACNASTIQRRVEKRWRRAQDCTLPVPAILISAIRVRDFTAAQAERALSQREQVVGALGSIRFVASTVPIIVQSITITDNDNSCLQFSRSLDNIRCKVSLLYC